MSSPKTYTKVRVDFLISEPDLPLDDITRELGIKPSKIIRRGQPTPGGKGGYRRDAWYLSSGLSPDTYLENHVRAVLQQVHPLRDKVSSLCARLNTVPEVSACVESYGADRPALHVDEHLVLQIADLGASFDIDFYIFDPDDEDE